RGEEIKPEDFPAFVKNLVKNGYVGANVTAPHKAVALELSEPDERARAVGAVNTLWLEGDRLRSTNTDIEGFIGALDATAPGWDERIESAVVLGAGGAARAIVFGLLERGVTTIRIVNRTFERAVELRELFGPNLHPARWHEVPRLLADASLLINA